MTKPTRLRDRAADRVAHAVGATLGSRLDAFFVRWAFQTPVRPLNEEAKARVRAELDEASTGYVGVLDAAPPACSLAEAAPIRRLPGGEVFDVAPPSGYIPKHPSFAKMLAEMPSVAVAHARWYRHERASPTLILLHGWGMGNADVDARLLQAKYFYGQGLDVLLLSAPFHGRRVPQGRKKPVFPSSRPIRAIEGFAMWLSDVRAFTRAFLASGRGPVALCGLSMGGFAATLAATTNHELSLIAPVIPFADLPALLWDQANQVGGIDPGAAASVDRQRFVQAFSAIAPLSRAPRTESTTMHVFGGLYDRVTPVSHARDIAAHFDCGYTEMASSHLLQVGRSGWTKSVARMCEATLSSDS